MLTIEAHAKINITLDVLGKRPDGYHEVAMIMQTVDLADRIHLHEREAEITMTVDVPGLAGDTSNLAHRAAVLLQKRFVPQRGVHIELQKRIPIAAGLAGGSADAAAVLIGLNRLWGLQLDIDQLAELGSELGSDVPFCVKGGTMLATGRGEKLTPLPAMPDCWVILAKLPISVSTAWVYGNYRPDMGQQHPDTAAVIGCLEQQNLPGIAERLCNVLESVTIPAYPQIGELKERLQQYGAMAVLMSGSGPTVFGLVREKQLADQIAAKLRADGIAEVFVTKVLAEVGENEK